MPNQGLLHPIIKISLILFKSFPTRFQLTKVTDHQYRISRFLCHEKNWVDRKQEQYKTYSPMHISACMTMLCIEIFALLHLGRWRKHHKPLLGNEEVLAQRQTQIKYGFILCTTCIMYVGKQQGHLLSANRSR